MKVTPEEYLDKLVDFAMLKIYAIATVKETSQTWSAEDDFIVEKTTLQLDVRGPKNLIVDQAFGLEIKMVNPLNKYLTDNRLSIEAPGFQNTPRTVRIKDIGPREQFVFVEELVPQKFGPRNIVVVFSSRDLTDVVGSKQVEVFSN